MSLVSPHFDEKDLGGTFAEIDQLSSCKTPHSYKGNRGDGTLSRDTPEATPPADQEQPDSIAESDMTAEEIEQIMLGNFEALGF